jgi:hypothetical protein
MKTNSTLKCIAYLCAVRILKAFPLFITVVSVWRKFLLSTLYAMITGCLVFSQGNQTAVQVPVTESGRTLRWALLHLPDDYATSSTKYPLVVFLHGKGEQGTCICPSDLPLLYNSAGAGGPSYFIARNQWPSSFVNPADGRSYKFIVISPQAENGWSTSGLSLGIIIKHMVDTYRVDTTRIYVTGISAGGMGVVDYVVHNAGEPRYKAAAFVPMSAVINPTIEDAEYVVSDSIRALSFGDPINDVHGTNTRRLIDNMNSIESGYGRFVNYSGGHCCWNTYYNPNWNDAVTGLSVWEWMLTNQRDAPNMTVLPVNFLGFDVISEGSELRFEWRVAVEDNVVDYQVEKSHDGFNFNTIGSVPASGQDAYHFTHGAPLVISYYRVKSVDHNGKYKYTDVKRVDPGDAALRLKAYPIPAQNEVTIQHSMADVNSKLLLLAADGRLMQRLQLNRGSRQTSLNLHALQAGLYFVKYEDGNGRSETLRFTKQ